jgi:hypothetical protein
MDNSQLSVATGARRCSKIQTPTTTTYAVQTTDSSSIRLWCVRYDAIQSTQSSQETGARHAHKAEAAQADCTVAGQSMPTNPPCQCQHRAASQAAPPRVQA